MIRTIYPINDYEHRHVSDDPIESNRCKSCRETLPPYADTWCSECSELVCDSEKCLIDVPGVGEMCVDCAVEHHPEAAWNAVIQRAKMGPGAFLRDAFEHATRWGAYRDLKEIYAYVINEAWLVLDGRKPEFAQPGWVPRERAVVIEMPKPISRGKQIKSLMEDSGYSRSEATALVKAGF